jgi:hypothetical protein
MQKAIHKTRDKNHARRLTAMLMLHRGEPSVMLPEHSAVPAIVGRWINWFTLSGAEGLKSLPQDVETLAVRTYLRIAA